MGVLHLSLFIFIFLSPGTWELKFSRQIEAVGYPFYKIFMSLGTCKEKILYNDQSVWGTVRLNRILDIYYESSNIKYKVSRVEIYVVLNNTDCFAYSKTGIGKSVFMGTLYLPTNLGMVLYSISIFTCSKVGSTDVTDNKYIEDLDELPFGQHLKLLPFYYNLGIPRKISK